MSTCCCCWSPSWRSCFGQRDREPTRSLCFGHLLTSHSCCCCPWSCCCCYLLGCDDLQFFCKKSFGPLIFECRLPKETSLSIWGTFTMFPIPPSSTTLVTEFFEERGKMDFPHFLVFYLARWFHMLLNPHQLPKQTIWYAWNYFGVPPYMCTGVTLVTENPFTGRKAQKCPNVLKEH